VVGISRGGSGNTAVETDLSAAAGGTLAYAGLGAIYEAFTTTKPVDLDGVTLTFAPTAPAPAPNQPPLASIGASVQSGPAPLSVAFQGHGADADGTVVSYHWDFGDGTASAEQNPAHGFGTDGVYTVTLTVTDDQGATGVAGLKVYVGTTPPPVDTDGSGGEPPSGSLTPVPGDPGSAKSPMVIGACAVAAPGAAPPTAGLLAGLLLAVLRRRRRA
jgi:MYXO-CTERM domain-containing protein